MKARNKSVCVSSVYKMNFRMGIVRSYKYLATQQINREDENFLLCFMRCMEREPILMIWKFSFKYIFATVSFDLHFFSHRIQQPIIRIRSLPANPNLKFFIRFIFLNKIIVFPQEKNTFYSHFAFLLNY